MEQEQLYSMVKEELIRELEMLPEEEKDKPIIMTMQGPITARQLIEELKKDTELAKKIIAGEIRRRFRERYKY